MPTQERDLELAHAMEYVGMGTVGIFNGWTPMSLTVWPK
nr:hypothetical protein Iba_chr12bCG17010 [Ipomoea batatas]